MEREQPKPRPEPEPAREVELDPRVVANRCPFCRESVRADEERWVACAQCLARQHLDCWDEGGRCAACGHGERMVPPASHAPPSTAVPPANPLKALAKRRLLPIMLGAIFGGVGAILSTTFAILWFVGAQTKAGAHFPLWPALFPLLFVAVGGGVLALAARSIGRDRRILREGTLAHGEVLEAQPDYHVRMNGRPLVRVRCRFTDAAGAAHELSDGTFDPTWQHAAVGKRVRVAYLPGAPGDGLIVDLLR